MKNASSLFWKNSKQRKRLFWPLAAVATTVAALWVFFANGGLTGLAREAMTISMEVYGETVFFTSFKLLSKMATPFVLTICALFCWWMALRDWASYYLNRKLIVSYLFFAFIPLLSTSVIFVIGARTLYGVTAAHGVEKGMQVFADTLNSYTERVQQQMLDYLNQTVSQPGASFKAKQEVNRILNINKIKDLTGKPFRGFTTNLFYQETQPGQPWWCLNSQFPGTENQIHYPLIIMPGNDLYPTIHPPWLSQHVFSGIIREKNLLFFKSYRFYENNQFRLVIQAALPIDRYFLGKLQERQSVNLTLEGLNEPWQIVPEQAPAQWYVRLFLRPLRSIWTVEILDWKTGNSSLGAQMVFDVAPNLVSSQEEDHSDVFLGSNQIRIQFAFIIFIIGILVLGELFALVFGFVLIGYITRSLDILATGNDIVAQGQLSYRLPNMGKDQLGAMAKSFNAMVSNIQGLLAQSKEKERLQEELRIARDIQMSLLPSLEGSDLKPILEKVRLDAVCIPAKEVGGDYFEILDVGNGKMGILVADVSGKGTSAAFYMAEMKGILLALRALWGSPKDLVTELNTLLYQALKPHVFISAIYVLFDPHEKSVEIVRAGHCPAIAVRKDREPEPIQPQGIALGLTTQDRFAPLLDSQTIHLESGEKLVLYTDGLDEMISGEELYGFQRLVEKTFDERKSSPTSLIDAILSDVKDFIQAGEQSDDLTLVVIEMPAGKGEELGIVLDAKST